MAAKKDTRGPGEGGAREAMVRAAAELLAEGGVAGASFSSVIERSGAPRGSIYHHFPDGKDQLAAEAIEGVGARLRERIEAMPSDDVEAIVRGFLKPWRGLLARSNNQAGCAVAALANERATNPALAERARAVFTSWERALHDKLVEAGVPSAEARDYASLVLAGAEGALVLCRAHDTIAPLDRVEASLLRAAPRPGGARP